MFCCFILKKGKKNVNQRARKKICDVYGKDALWERVCQKYFAKFHSDFDIK